MKWRENEQGKAYVCTLLKVSIVLQMNAVAKIVICNNYSLVFSCESIKGDLLNMTILYG